MAFGRFRRSIPVTWPVTTTSPSLKRSRLSAALMLATLLGARTSIGR
jgi:hypothetical protein